MVRRNKHVWGAVVIHILQKHLINTLQFANFDATVPLVKVLQPDISRENEFVTNLAESIVVICWRMLGVSEIDSIMFCEERLV